MISVDTNIVEEEFFFFGKRFSEKSFFQPIFGVTGLQVQDEPKQMSPSHPAREEMVQDPVGWFQGAQNAEK